jgi:cytochrome bd-type quinol oxidase subunit 2
MGTVAFLTLLYHGLRIIYPRDVTLCVEENIQERNTLLIIYIFHLSIVAPLLAYIAYKGRQADNRVWGSLLGLSIILFMYHGVRYFYPRVVKENC